MLSNPLNVYNRSSVFLTFLYKLIITVVLFIKKSFFNFKVQCNNLFCLPVYFQDSWLTITIIIIQNNWKIPNMKASLSSAFSIYKSLKMYIYIYILKNMNALYTNKEWYWLSRAIFRPFHTSVLYETKTLIQVALQKYLLTISKT